MKPTRNIQVKRSQKLERNDEQITHATSWSRRRKRGVRIKKPFNWRSFLSSVWRYFRFTVSTLAFIVLFLSPYLGWQYLVLNNVFPIKQVNIYSDAKYLVGERKDKLIQDLIGKNFVSFDFDAYRKNLSNNPWVKTAEVQRRWPDAIDIAIEERKPIAIWNDLYLIEADGTIFEPDLMPSDIVISLQGNDAQRERLLSGMTTVKKAMNSVNLDVEKIILDYRGAWTIILENDVELYLGARFFEERLQRFVAHYPSSIHSKMDQVMAIDFRYDHGYALKWKQQ